MALLDLASVGTTTKMVARHLWFPAAALSLAACAGSGSGASGGGTPANATDGNAVTSSTTGGPISTIGTGAGGHNTGAGGLGGNAASSPAGVGGATTTSGASSGAGDGGASSGTSGGMTTQSTGAGGMGGSGTTSSGTTGTPIVVDVELESSVPDQYKQPIASGGSVTRRSYPCYHYTDDTAGLEVEPSALVLEPREQPITKEFNIYLPPSYDTELQYPVVYVLHGLTDNEDTWLERGDPTPPVLLDNLIASGVIQPVVAVFPNGNSSSQFLTRTFENQAGYYYFANELTNDLIPFVEAEYSVKTDRGSRGICGFSMGGMQTINAGLCQSLDHFAWFGAFAAAPTTYTALRIAEYARAQDPQAHPIHYFYNICGESDDTRESHEPALDGLTEYSEYLTEDNVAYHNVPGGHDYVVSSVGLYNFLRIAFSK